MSEDIKARIDVLKFEQGRIHADIGPKQARLMEIYEELRPLEGALSKSWIDSMVTPDWPVIIKELAGGPRSSVALIRYAEKHLAQYSMYGGGSWTDTQEACFKLMLTRGSPESLAKALAGVKLFTPIYTPHKDGYVHFGIFEHTLSAGAVYHFKIKPDLSEVLVGSRWSEKKFTDLEQSLLHVQAHHWYDDAHGQDQEDSDDD